MAETTTPFYQQHRLLRARDWQDRAEFQQLLDWWKRGEHGRGVCALVGIGGAGKTAIADRFLQLLPDNFVLAPPGVDKRADLPPAERLFVFSFYDEPNADAFFRQLGECLGLKTAADGGKAGYQICIQALQSAPNCLLVLDGLERVQEDGSRGVKLALDDGIPADEATGQPELLAANDPECGYGWGIAGGHSLRAEIAMLQAAQALGCHRSDGIRGNSDQALGVRRLDAALDGPATSSGQAATESANDASPASQSAVKPAHSKRNLRGEERPDDGAPAAPDEILANSATETIAPFLKTAREEATTALELWRLLRDPEGEAEINYQGIPTQQMLEKLDRWEQTGESIVLTDYPLEPIATTAGDDSSTEPEPATDSNAKADFDVFLSHNSQDKPVIRELAKKLKDRDVSVWIDEEQFRPGLPWQEELDRIIKTCKSSMICIGAKGFGPWETPEMQALLSRFVNEKKEGKIVPVIPVLLPDAPEHATLPAILANMMWVDLRQGIDEAGLDKLEWGITGEKPE